MVKFVSKMEKIRLEPMESVDSQDSRIEIDEDDDDFSDDDDDDDVFIRNNGTTAKKNGKKKNGVVHKKANNRKDDEVDSGGEAGRPLMRKKKKKYRNGSAGDVHAAHIKTSRPKYRRCCGPLCCIFLAFKTLIGLLIITVVLVNYFTHAGWFNWLGWPSSSSTAASYMSSGIDGSMTGHGDGFAPCHDLEIIPVWQMKFPKVATTV